MNRTLNRCVIDHEFGFLTSKDGDSGTLMLGTNCSRCGKEFFVEVDSNYEGLAPMYCTKCQERYRRSEE